MRGGTIKLSSLRCARFSTKPQLFRSLHQHGQGRINKLFSIGGAAAEKCAKLPLSSGRCITTLAEQEALIRIAGLLEQAADLRRAFDAFGDQRKPQTLRHSDNGIGQTRAEPRPIMGLNISNKSAVNF